MIRLSPPWFGIEQGTARSTLPSRACAGARNRQSGIGQKNVHRVGRVSGGLLNPSGGARNRPRNKSVLAQSENELNDNFASGNKIRLNHFQKTA
jgi:hypothetical protein